MKKIHIGLVDLDTSHPGNFIPILRELGHEVTTVYDGGTINPAGYAEKFAQDNGIATVSESLEHVVERVDAVFIHSCDWDLHVERARPFVEAGKSVFIDKPIAGNLRDLRQFVQWAKSGAIITGGSSLRVCEEVRAWREEGIPQEDWIYGNVGCAVDEYNYGIHAYSLLHGLMGPGIKQARYLGSAGGQRQIELQWTDARVGTICVGHTRGYLPFYANVVTQKRVDFIKADNSKLYTALLENVMPYLAGEAREPLPMEQLIEVEMAAIAGKLSEERGGSAVSLSEIPSDYAGYDGLAFAKMYKELKYPSQLTFGNL